MTETQTLKNGITVLLSTDDRAETACVLVGVAIGANNEEKNEYGLAHFFEHMCFKGTKTYPTNQELVTRMDESGLVANAYTDREYTAYHMSGRAERLQDMLHLTADIFLYSLFPANELDKEKKVIIEEIAMYRDDPPSRAFDEVNQSLFHDTAAGHPILGTEESVASFSRDNFTHFLQKHYTAKNTIISIAGKFDRDSTLQKLEKLYSDTRQGEQSAQATVSPTAPKETHRSIVRNDLEQTHIVIGGYTPSYNSTDRHTTEVFDVIFGGSMSSRLFLRVREKLGACYTIKTLIDLMTHTGEFAIYTGIGGKRTTEVMGAIADECAIIKKTPVPEAELKKAKEFLLGLNAVQQESKSAIASEQMHAYAQSGTPENNEEYKRNILAVTADDVQRIANSILDNKKLTTCYVSNTEIPETITENFYSGF
ncbi:MAG: pitrilysin family protein [Candidatus Kaiserbacteria bacterium]|nr:pitrilysin family protein [Candidatus Kaiserbacteria bacterium]